MWDESRFSLPPQFPSAGRCCCTVSKLNDCLSEDFANSDSSLTAFPTAQAVLITKTATDVHTFRTYQTFRAFENLHALPLLQAVENRENVCVRKTVNVDVGAVQMVWCAETGRVAEEIKGVRKTGGIGQAGVQVGGPERWERGERMYAGKAGEVGEA
ncbi:hypothetical protein TREMEDRAFT_66416 [Tremella mesenterica DSM 1558]|uniref:uncharacterized protein n=1 Tax=Tremella mesenterica (strain ATCC 24925 / CBS 8224 / DSM 1558 / NBRC 9311 / NRRL Y-6157 / RJB 2259-6 / UBC 559-6) TaxID=578456 RepID=UPI00032C9879|nr:uncharacterized protein TREMEDRAFT_66416 [Tremella mesenterica DSM 1558]EIW65586.1 hypothetical protein TREMEDRAFT_66416 [Tremella mesenterica DSM 1558]